MMQKNIDTQDLKSALLSVDLSVDRDPVEVNEEFGRVLELSGYNVVIREYGRPWGGFNQLANEDADRFIEEFFPGLSPEEARLGNPDSELSPKILLVAPGATRLSWQYHNRRAERWFFLNDGGYIRSVSDEQGDLHTAKPGEVVQFAELERHRLVSAKEHFTIVAEIWQHTEPNNLSDEEDIIRLDDDYSR